MKELMKEVQAFLRDLRARPFPVDFVALRELSIKVDASLAPSDIWRGVPREYRHAYNTQGDDIVFLPVPKDMMTPDCIVYIRRGNILHTAPYGDVWFVGQCIEARL